MKRSFVCCVVACFLACFAVFACVSHAADKPIKLEYASFLPVNDPIGQVLQEFGTEIEKRTAGRVTITFHPGGTLTPMPQTYDSVVTGIADMAFGMFGNTPGRFPMMELLDIPTGIKTSALSARMAKEYVAHFKPKELQEVKVLFLASTTPAIIHTKKPIRKLEDLKGLKIRTIGGPMVQVLQGLGAVPVVIPSVDCYDSASKGVIDGTYSAWPGMTTFKWFEVLPCSVANYRTSASATQFVIMNKDKWNAMPPDVQSLIDKTSQEYAIKVAEAWDRVAQDTIRKLTAGKQTITSLSAGEEERWYQRALPVYDTYIKEKSAKGLPAAAAVKFVRDWVANNQK